MVVQCRAAVSAAASGAAAMNPILRECFNILFIRVPLFSDGLMKGKWFLFSRFEV